MDAAYRGIEDWSPEDGFAKICKRGYKGDFWIFPHTSAFISHAQGYARGMLGAVCDVTFPPDQVTGGINAMFVNTKPSNLKWLVDHVKEETVTITLWWQKSGKPGMKLFNKAFNDKLNISKRNLIRIVYGVCGGAQAINRTEPEKVGADCSSVGEIRRYSRTDLDNAFADMLKELPHPPEGFFADETTFIDYDTEANKLLLEDSKVAFNTSFTKPDKQPAEAVLFWSETDPYDPPPRYSGMSAVVFEECNCCANPPVKNEGWNRTQDTCPLETGSKGCGWNAQLEKVNQYCYSLAAPALLTGTQQAQEAAAKLKGSAPGLLRR
jgi:hypothetical protein